MSNLNDFTRAIHGFRMSVTKTVALCSILIGLRVTLASSVVPLPPPSNLSALAVSSSQINLTWTDNSSNEDGFIIQRSTSSGSGFSDIDTVAAGVTNFSDTGLGQNTTYYYKVAAYNASERADSNEANATTPLAAPSNLAATAVSSEQINLAWTDLSSGEDGFKIELKDGVGGTYAELATVGANVTTYASTGLDPSATYYFRVRAFSSAAGNSAYSNEADATTLPDPPAAPSGLTATPVSNSQINLAWTDHANNESGYRIESKLSSAVSFIQIATIGANETTYSNPGLSTTTSYVYRVRAYNAGGNSAYSNQANATTLIDPPTAPSSLTATTVSNSQINLSWSDNATTETGFRIERKTGPSGTYAPIDSVGANVTSYASTGLIGSTEYYYRVRAKNAGGSSAYSNEANATTQPDAPAAPGNLAATAVSNEQIDLTWHDPSNYEDGFKIEIKVGAGGTYTEIATVAANDTMYSNTGLEAGTEYFYRLRAFNAAGHSSYSNEASATTQPEPPAAPSLLTATTVNQTQINLTWTDNANNESGFKIERKLSSASAFTQIETVGPEVTSYSSTGLTANTAYAYRVRAFNATGHSAYSNEAGATTLPNPPAAPSALTATTISNTQINLAWTDNANNESGFRIERKIGAGGTFVQIDSVGPDAVAYSNNGLSDNTQYYYRVRAYNTGGASAYSNEATATTLPTPPAAPSSLTATTVSNAQINLAWTDNANNEDGFKIERKIGTGGTYAQIDSVGANVIAYSSPGLNGNTEYFYRVRAYNLGGVSAFSNEAGATTTPDLPAAPSSLTATTVGSSEINLAWTDNANDEAGFIIEIKVAEAGAFTELDSVGANTTNYASTGLNPSTQYFFRVRAFNITGNSSYSNEASATTNPEPPATPSGLAATAVSNTQINLAWTDNSNNETGFKIEGKLTSAATFTQIATVDSNVTSYASTGLAGNTSYTFRVRAYNASGNSSYSSTTSTTTLVDPPAVPSNLTATAASQTQINLAWQDNSGNEDGFKIERKTAGDTAYTQIATVGANTTSYSSTGLSASTQYFYRVRAHRSGSNSDYSNVADATTFPGAPAAPSSLTATAMSTSQINLAWMDNANNEIGFVIARKLGAAGIYAVIDTIGADTTSYADTGLNAGTQYFYQVRAYNLGGNSAYSDEASATTVPNPPTAPDGLAATAVSHLQINLAWQDQSSNEAGFKIERKTGAGGTYAPIDSVGPNATSYASTGLLGSTTYFYRVRAYNAGGHSAYSTEANATTLPNPPAAPSNLLATTVNSDQINLTWKDNSSDENGFYIELKIGAGGTYALIDSASVNDTTYASAGLDPNTSYFYRVRAFNAGGSSAYSNEAGAATNPDLPLAPSNLMAVAVTSTKINLTWEDNANNESGFKIERKLTSAATFTEIATVGPNVTSYTSTGLTANTSYMFRVRAYNVTANSAYSNTASTTTLVSPPAAPSVLTATGVSSSQINLAWTDNASNEDGFKVERKAAGDTAFVEIAALGANTTNYASTGLEAITVYFFRVRAHRNGNSFSAYSNVASDTTLAPPAAPGNLTATAISKTQINLTWTDNSADEDSFKIERKIGAAGTYVQIKMVGANVTNFANIGLSANTTYFYRVRTHNANGNSAYSNEAGALTFMNGPSNLVATTVSGSQINLVWTDNTANETEFQIERKTGVAGTFAQIGTAAQNATSFSSSGLNPDTQYFYRVRAINSGNVSGYSNEADATTFSVLAEPSNLTATAISKTQINLTWTDNSANEDSFKIERKIGAAGTYAAIAAVGANMTSYSNIGLVANTTYFYRVQARKANGNSAYSNEASALTFMHGPSNLAATTVSGSQITLTWTDNTANETEFQIERKTGVAGTFSLIGTAAKNAPSFSSTGLNPDTQYFYRVRAINASNVSGYTNEADATTLSALPEPSSLTATAISMSQINLTWTDNSAIEDSFKIERKIGAAGTYSKIATVGANVTSFSDTGLLLNLTYFYRVRASNDTLTSAYSNEANATTFIKAPINLVATTISASQINLIWTDKSATETGFKIERKIGVGGTYAEIATVGANVTAFSNTGLTANTTYFYRVRGVSATTVSDYTNEASATTSVAKAAAENAALQPTTIALAPNYPNPFNPATTISYALPAEMHVTLKVIDLAGHEVATLVDGYQNVGIHRVTFKAAKLPSGTYYAVLKAGEVTQVQRMTLAK